MRSEYELSSDIVAVGWQEMGLIAVIEDAEAQGLLHPNTGSVLFEGTVGSTGISLATVGRAK